MRIAILHPGMHIKGGAENIAVWLCDGLGKRGHEVAILTDNFDPGHWPDELVAPLDIRILPELPLSRWINSNAVRSWERSRQLGVLLREFDLVIAQRFPFYCWATEGRAREAGDYRIVWLCQEPLRRLYPEVTDRNLLAWRSLAPEGAVNPHLDEAAAKRVGRSRSQKRKDTVNRRKDALGVSRCDLIVANSAFTAANVQDIFGVEATTCHLGIPMPPEPEYTRGDYVAVLTALAPRKNVPNLLRAIAELAGRGRGGIRMKIAGHGPDREKLVRMAQELGVGDSVDFVGTLRDVELPAFYANARLLLYCPVDEPFGLVPLEAAAVKTPSVVSDHGGPAEIIENGLTGLHANPFDHISIANAVETLWDDETRARRLAEAACRRTREYFSLDGFVDRFEKILSGNL